MINTTSEKLKAKNFFICRYFSFYVQLKLRAELRWAWKTLYNLGPSTALHIPFIYSLYTYYPKRRIWLCTVTISLSQHQKRWQPAELPPLWCKLTLSFLLKQIWANIFPRILELFSHWKGDNFNISGRGSAISSAQEREIKFYLFGKEFISCLNCANVCAVREILTVTFINP